MTGPIVATDGKWGQPVHLQNTRLWKRLDKPTDEEGDEAASSAVSCFGRIMNAVASHVTSILLKGSASVCVSLLSSLFSVALLPISQGRSDQCQPVCCRTHCLTYTVALV